MKSNNEIIDEIIIDQVGCLASDLTSTSILQDDLSFDSLDDLELKMELERVFNLAISDEENFITVQDIYDYVDDNYTKD